MFRVSDVPKHHQSLVETLTHRAAVWRKYWLRRIITTLSGFAHAPNSWSLFPYDAHHPSYDSRSSPWTRSTVLTKIACFWSLLAAPSWQLTRASVLRSDTETCL